MATKNYSENLDKNTWDFLTVSPTKVTDDWGTVNINEVPGGKYTKYFESVLVDLDAEQAKNSILTTDDLVLGEKSLDNNKLVGTALGTVSNSNKDGVDFQINDITLTTGSSLTIDYDATVKFNSVNYDITSQLIGTDNDISYQYFFVDGLRINTTGMSTDKIYKVMEQENGEYTLDQYKAVIKNFTELKNTYSVGAYKGAFYLNLASQETIYVNSAWSNDKADGDVIDNKYIYGYNGFSSIGSTNGTLEGKNYINSYATLESIGVKNVVLMSDTTIDTANAAYPEFSLRFTQNAAINSDKAGEVRTITVDSTRKGTTANNDLLILGNTNYIPGDKATVKPTITIGKDVAIESNTNVWFGYFQAKDGTSNAPYLGNFAADIVLDGDVVLKAGTAADGTIGSSQAHVFGRGTTMTVSETGSLNVETSSLQIRGADMTVKGTYAGKDTDKAQIIAQGLDLEGDVALADYTDTVAESMIIRDADNKIIGYKYGAADASLTIDKSYFDINGNFGINTATGNRASGKTNADVTMKNGAKLEVAGNLTMADNASFSMDGASTADITGNLELGNGANIAVGSEINVMGGSKLSAANVTTTIAEGQEENVEILVSGANSELNADNAITLAADAKLTVDAGAVVSANQINNNGQILVKDATLAVEDILNDAKEVVTPGKITLGATSDVRVAGKSTISGDVDNSVTAFGFEWGYEAKAIESTYADEFTGDFTVVNGTLTVKGTLKNGAYSVLMDAEVSKGSLILDGAVITNSSFSVDGEISFKGVTESSITALTVNEDAAFTMDTASVLTLSGAFTDNGTITIDNADLAANTAWMLIDGAADQAYDTEEYFLTDATKNQHLVVAGDDLWITDTYKNTILIDATMESGDKTTDGYVFGYNAFATIADAVAAKDDTTTTYMFRGENNTYNVTVNADDLKAKNILVDSGITNFAGVLTGKNVEVNEDATLNINELNLTATAAGTTDYIKTGVGTANISTFKLTTNDAMKNNSSYVIATGVAGAQKWMINNTTVTLGVFQDDFQLTLKGDAVTVRRLATHFQNNMGGTNDALDDRWYFMGKNITADDTYTISSNYAVTAGKAGYYVFGGNYIGIDNVVAQGINKGTLEISGTAEFTHNGGIVGGNRIEGKNIVSDVLGTQTIHIATANDAANETKFVYGGSIVKGEGSISNATGNLNMTIDSGKLGYVFGGGFAQGIDSTDNRKGKINLTVNGGIIRQLVGGGQAGKEGSVSVEKTNIVINNGTIGEVFGGNHASSAKDSANSIVSNGTNITVDGFLGDVSVKNIYGGSYAYGTIFNGTNVNFVSCDANDSFTLVSGDSSFASNAISFVTGTRSLSVESSTLNIAELTQFDKVSVADSNVKIASGNLDDVKLWSIDWTSSFEFGAASNDFAGDVLDVSFDKGTTGTETLFSGASEIAGFESFDQVAFNGTELTFTEGKWAAGNMSLALSDDKKSVIATLA